MSARVTTVSLSRFEKTDNVDQTCGDWGIPMEEGVDCTGHEGAGVVAAVGPGVTTFRVGDRVGITPVAKTCETCDTCTSGREYDSISTF